MGLLSNIEKTLFLKKQYKFKFRDLNNNVLTVTIPIDTELKACTMDLYEITLSLSNDNQINQITNLIIERLKDKIENDNSNKINGAKKMCKLWETRPHIFEYKKTNVDNLGIYYTNQHGLSASQERQVKSELGVNTFYGYKYYQDIVETEDLENYNKLKIYYGTNDAKKMVERYLKSFTFLKIKTYLAESYLKTNKKKGQRYDSKSIKVSLR